MSCREREVTGSLFPCQPGQPIRGSPRHDFSLCGPGQLFQPFWPPLSRVISPKYLVSPRHDL